MNAKPSRATWSGESKRGRQIFRAGREPLTVIRCLGPAIS
jgi:hypothetical protein